MATTTHINEHPAATMLDAGTASTATTSRGLPAAQQRSRLPTSDSAVVVGQSTLRSAISQKSVKRAKRKMNGNFHLFASLAMAATTAFWLSSLWSRGSVEFNSILRDSAAVFAVCNVMDMVLHVGLPQVRSRYVLCHFTLGICLQMIYVLTFCIGGSGKFAEVWRPVYFGYYVWSIVIIVLRPGELFFMFRVFYTIHHTVSFLITGTWMRVTCCPWNEYLLCGIMLWISSDIYVYLLNVFRCLRPNVSSLPIWPKVQLSIFCLERCHRGAAYIQALVITGGELNTLDCVVLGTGLFNDALDALFQARSIFQSFGRIKQLSGTKSSVSAPAPAAAPEDVIEEDPPSNLVVRQCSLFDHKHPKEMEKVWSEASLFDDFRKPEASHPSTLVSQKQSRSIFSEGPNAMQQLFTQPTFDKSSQWELTPKQFQELTHDRLRLLAATGLFKISFGPGMHAPGEAPRGRGTFRALLEAFHLLGAYDLSLFDVLGVHAIGGNVVFIHGSEQQLKQHRDAIDTVSDVYCFGGTELAHGSNLKAVQTAAELDIASDEFVLQTPAVTGCKYWIGNSTFVADYVVVLASVAIGGEDKGVHWLRVPLWRETTEGRERYPGVEVRDVGAKAGCNGIGNGCICFNAVRVPRDALLMRFCSVAKGGLYKSALSHDERFIRCIQTFVLERIVVATAAIGCAKVALYVALRYATTRRQFGPDADTEVPLLSYALHRQRLFVHVARIFSAKTLINHVGDTAERFFQPYEFDADRKTLHATSCLVKSFGCWDAFAAAQEARECCGGHGFAAVAQVGMIRNDLDVTLTFAGDNSLLALEVVRFRLKQLNDWPMWKKVLGPQPPFLWNISKGAIQDPPQLLYAVAQALVYREELLLWLLARQLRGDREGAFERFTQRGFEMREAARAVYDRMCVATWRKQHSGCRTELIDRLGMLDALVRLQQQAAWYLSRRVMSSSSFATIEKLIGLLCDRLGEHPASILEAMCIPDSLVQGWPLTCDDYCQRMRDLATPCDDPNLLSI